VASSHKGVITDHFGNRLAAVAAVVESRDRRILELLDHPRTLAELTAWSPFYGGRADAPRILDYWEGEMVRKHFVRLERRGLIRPTEPTDASRSGPENDAVRTAGTQGSSAGPGRNNDDRTRWSRR
jgi:hypothetical protein